MIGWMALLLMVRMDLLVSMFFNKEFITSHPLGTFYGKKKKKIIIFFIAFSIFYKKVSCNGSLIDVHNENYDGK